MANDAIEIIQGGTFTTVQDGGRYRLAHLGVPVSGFLDEPAAQLANWMVGNEPGDALFELTWTGIEFRINCDCSIAIAGAEFECLLNGAKISTDAVIQLRAGDHFKMARLLNGVRAYVTFAGSFDLPVFGGSMSTLSVAGLGGFKGRALSNDDVLRLKHPQHVEVKQKPLWKKLKTQSVHVIRAMPGPEFNAFSPTAIRQAFGQAYQLSNDSNRQGFRLLSENIESPKNFNMQSSGLVAGSLQLTPDGQTILAMKDAQTSGGYPRILVVNQDQLHLLAQIRPGEDIYFYVAHNQGTGTHLSANYR